MLIIPFTRYPSFTEQVTLDTVPYNLAFNFNSRGEYWTMTINDTDGNQLVAGIKLVLNYELIADFAWLGLPPGEVWAIDTSDTLDSIGYDDLIENVNLVYVPEAEV